MAGKQHKPPGEARAMAPQIARAAQFPIHEALIPAELFERGLGNLLFSRSLPDGHMAVAAFLLDVFCLGVKNAFVAVVARDEYTRRLSHRSTKESLQPMQPACFRKLVEGGVAYAQDLGFSPHQDYAVASQIFGDLESAPCPTRFVYGQDGKPSMFLGPMRRPRGCGPSSSSFSTAWAQETLTTSCWLSNPAD
jgi:hypothetical protein